MLESLSFSLKFYTSCKGGCKNHHISNNFWLSLKIFKASPFSNVGISFHFCWFCTSHIDTRVLYTHNVEPGSSSHAPENTVSQYVPSSVLIWPGFCWIHDYQGGLIVCFPLFRWNNRILSALGSPCYICFPVFLLFCHRLHPMILRKSLRRLWASAQGSWTLGIDVVLVLCHYETADAFFSHRWVIFWRLGICF